MQFPLSDMAVLIVSTACCIYCLILSRRLRVLRDQKSGLGATIQAFSKTISSLATATHDTCLRASKVATELARLIEEAEASNRNLEKQLRFLEGLHSGTERRVEAAKNEIMAAKQDLLCELRERTKEAEAWFERMRQETSKMLEQEKVLIARLEGLSAAESRARSAVMPSEKHVDLGARAHSAGVPEGAAREAAKSRADPRAGQEGAGNCYANIVTQTMPMGLNFGED